MAKNVFTTVQMSKPKKSRFDLSHDVKMSGKMGVLYPTLAMECLPGDFIKVGCESLLRFAPMLAPIMHRVDVTFHWWYVPNRLVWENFTNFISNTGTHVAPYITMNNTTITPDQIKFLDYLGIPPIPAGPLMIRNVSAIPVAAYQMIYNNWYRDENLITKVDDQLVDGSNPIADFCALRTRAWEHDYFTSALPFAQKGPGVDIPLGTVVLDPDWLDDHPAGPLPKFVDNAGVSLTSVVNSTATSGGEIETSTGEVLAFDPNGSLSVSATTINDLRQAYQLQKWLERNARGGTRYVEMIGAHFGVRPQDSRLQIPEYISGVKSPVVISEVLNQTSSGPTPQGDMAGHGVSVSSGYGGSYFCQEHGYVIGVMSVIPRTAYQDGIPKHFLKTDYLDYYWPDFAHLGEQEILNQELYAYGSTPLGTFGYIPRYSEYRYLPSRVAGQFRDDFDYWHLGRKFGAQPTLSQSFIECDASNRIFAVQNSDDYLWMHHLMKIQAVRPIPKYGTPST